MMNIYPYIHHLYCSVSVGQTDQTTVGHIGQLALGPVVAKPSVGQVDQPTIGQVGQPTGSYGGR